ncbi:MAG: ribose 5-phosphate isomerase B [Parcubacteria group bacterium Gr01-1014_17]|nr:MAG: ribose 5-phosphate isomerase B [Parcubacteria group bacterium Gr01-1014_17]
MKEKIIVLGADHNGVAVKAVIKELLSKLGFIPIDLGPHTESEKVDYTDYAQMLGHIVNNGDSTRGILVCGTGVGMSIVANRFPNVRAALAHSAEVAQKTREHNDANVLCLGAWVNSLPENLRIVRAWLNTEFGEGRHVRRVEKTKEHSRDKIVFTNGIFDILHKGHIELFKFAKSLGGRLIVGINSDRTTKLLKGKGRPINSAQERKATLETIQYIDQVVVFDDTKTIGIIQDVKPDIVVKGGEWTSAEVRRRDKIPEKIEVRVCPLVMQSSGIKYSSTNVIEKIKNR